mmetsp:Transcript_31724/g.64556  ORF Transcript_31724/g.64556 Transcript_31724/m.64556 type:complete len:85 (+) Transcript_31724:961-1215(+)
MPVKPCEYIARGNFSQENGGCAFLLARKRVNLHVCNIQLRLLSGPGAPAFMSSAHNNAADSGSRYGISVGASLVGYSSLAVTLS